MKKLGLAAMLALLLSDGLAAAIYEIQFTGTITSGSASGFNPSISSASLTEFADLTGFQVSGSLYFDLGVALAPNVDIDGGGFITTSVFSTDVPVFVGQDLSIEGLTVPSAFFPMPAVFNQSPIPTIPGSTVTTSEISQSLRTQTQATDSAQSVVGGMKFANGWSGERFSGGNVLSLLVLINGGSSSPFFTVPPIGEFPDSWGPVAGGNGLFRFNQLMKDSTVRENFGIVEWYDVQGTFTIDSARGGFVAGAVATPEPGTLGLALASLAVVAAGVRRKSS